jgi:hypothetical protein
VELFAISHRLAAQKIYNSRSIWVIVVSTLLYSFIHSCTDLALITEVWILPGSCMQVNNCHHFILKLIWIVEFIPWCNMHILCNCECRMWIYLHMVHKLDSKVWRCNETMYVTFCNMLQCYANRMGGSMWIRLIWFRTLTSGWLLWTQYLTFGFH